MVSEAGVGSRLSAARGEIHFEGWSMKLPVFLLVGFVALALSGLPSAAEPLPERATGIWSTTDCGWGGLTLLVNSHAALMIKGQGLETSVAIVPAAWTGEAITLKIKGEERNPSLFLDSLKRCDALPGSMSVLPADVVAVFGQLGGIVALCRDLESLTTECVTTVADLIDVTGDGAFSHSELRQAMRAAGFFMAYGGLAARQREAFVSLDSLLIAQLAAAALGPFVVAHLLDAYDSDGDDAVSLEELLQDRSPEQAAGGILAELLAKAPPAVASVLLKSIPGFKASP